MLFVHGHNPDDANDADFNYRKNWVQAVDGLPSFQQTLEDPANTATLDIEAYFIRFVDQHRSIVEDARDIGDAVERILARHDSSYTPFMASPSTSVRVAIISFSKGTVSARLYLKSLETQQFDLPAPRAGFNPVSEFVALSPPNHGIALSPLLTLNLASGTHNGFSDTSRFRRGATAQLIRTSTAPRSRSQSAPLGSSPRTPLSRHPTDDPWRGHAVRDDLCRREPGRGRRRHAVQRLPGAAAREKPRAARAEHRGARDSGRAEHHRRVRRGSHTAIGPPQHPAHTRGDLPRAGHGRFTRIPADYFRAPRVQPAAHTPRAAVVRFSTSPAAGAIPCPSCPSKVDA